MTVSKKLFVRATYVLLAATTIVDVVLFVYVTVARHSSTVSDELFRDASAVMAGVPPSGYSASGEMVSVPAASKKGWAVRYATPRCDHCRADEAQWSIVKSKLIEKGYHIYEIPPSLSDSYSGDASELTSETQISFVDVGWMKRYRFTGTPTTLLFDGHGKVIWAHIGEMNEDDQKSVLQSDFFNRSGER